MLIIPPPTNIGNGSFGFILQTMLFLTNSTDHSLNNTLEDFYHLPIGASTDPNRPKCYGVYGCFPIEYPWKSANRLVSLYPESPLKIEPRYPVFNRNARLHPKFLDLNDPMVTREAGIDPTGNIFLIAHGYIESGDRPWIQNMVNALLDNDPDRTASVVIVDWGNGSSPPYSQAVANIRLIGAITAHVVHMIYEELGLANLNKVHMLGHSLGAHLSGYTGYTLQKDFGLMLGRITGMDPAEPLFGDTDPLVRLDPSDAKFVDIIHTDALAFSSGGLGMRDPIGHVDFYPNGGYNNPGCDVPIGDYMTQDSATLFSGIQQFLSCNHVRSHQFMLESLYTKCPFVGIACDSFDDFQQGHCFGCAEKSHRCVRFGIHSRQSYMDLLSDRRVPDVGAPLRVYSMTGSDSPFCRTHFRVTINMSASEESRLHGGEIGIVSLVVHSQKNFSVGEADTGVPKYETEPMHFSQESLFFEPGLTYMRVMAGKDVGVPTHAELTWEYKANPLNPLTWRILATPRVFIENIIVESMEHNTRLQLCPMYGDPVVAQQPKLFLEEYCRGR